MKDDRLISLNAAIDALNKKWRTCIIGESLIRDAGDTLKALPPAQPGWIPCSVALPTKEGVYLVTDKSAFGEKISMRYWNTHEKDAFWSGYESDVVLAWQPLPTPYREGGQDGEG